MKTGILLLLILLLAVPACRDDGGESPGSPVTPELALERHAMSSAESGLEIDRKAKPDVLTIEERVIENCYIVRDAVEAWARESGGSYPDTPWSKSPLGNTLYDLLPNSAPLMNPFTGHRVDPQVGVAAHAGESGYIGVEVGSRIAGYFITGCGHEDGIVIVTITKLPDPENDESTGKDVLRAQVK